MTKIFTRNPILLAGLMAIPAALVASPAHAQSGERLTSMLARADANGDGAVTWGEFMAMRMDTFERLDRNNDGYVDSKDRPRIMGARFDHAYGALERADANKDGRISRAELRDGRAPGFDAADTDQDRMLSAKEIAAIQPPR